MNTDPMEILLARLFASPDEVEQFLREPDTYARNCGLTDEQVVAVLEIDATSLRFAANSFERKRKSR
jgi:pantoate kinase